MPNPNPNNGGRDTQFTDDFFIYEADFASIASGITQNSNIVIQADSDFILVKLGLTADIAAAAQTSSTQIIPLCTLQIVDTGSGRQLFSNPVALPSIFGNGQLPFLLPVPRKFNARSNISLSLANYSAASTYQIKMAFIGFKRFIQS